MVHFAQSRNVSQPQQKTEQNVTESNSTLEDLRSMVRDPQVRPENIEKKMNEYLKTAKEKEQTGQTEEAEQLRRGVQDFLREEDPRVIISQGLRDRVVANNTALYAASKDANSWTPELKDLVKASYQKATDAENSGAPLEGMLLRTNTDVFRTKFNADLVERGSYDYARKLSEEQRQSGTNPNPPSLHNWVAPKALSQNEEAASKMSQRGAMPATEATSLSSVTLPPVKPISGLK